ncbi:hypothetical protein AGMMS49975_18230 [Clostridia bacterium]|nr:hypothetical protein AGMMS49975_18230 [Clostridia bacterium]
MLMVLYILDRGYPSRKLFAEMIDEKRFFLMRCRRNFNADFDMVQKKEKVNFLYSDKTYQVRIFRIETKFNSLKNKLEQ